MLIEFTERGFYCPPGDFYIDPWKSVSKAVITHAHSDHARPGHSKYLAHRFTVPLLRARLGDLNCQGVEWGEKIHINGVQVSLHPAGHVIGSSQVRIEYKGETWVISGDYKVEDDGISGAFEPLRCHCFVTESTFGLPVYNWKSQSVQFSEIQHWIRENQKDGKSSVLIAYSLGKAQRLLPCLVDVSEQIYIHGSVANIMDALQSAGIALPPVVRVAPDFHLGEKGPKVAIAPASTLDSAWLKKFSPYSVAICSGWMQVRGAYRRSQADAGFALSDHADWKGLLQAVQATGAEKIFVTHGFQASFSRYLNENGYQAAEVKTAYGEEESLAE